MAPCEDGQGNMSMRISSKRKTMKNPYAKINRTPLSLGDLVSAVSSSTRSKREAFAALLDLFESGRVRIKDHGHLKRVRVSAA